MENGVAAEPTPEVNGDTKIESPTVADSVLVPQQEPPAKKIKVETPEVVIPNHPEPPVHEVVGGSSVRQYLNKNLTEHLLEGLRKVAKEKPEDPLTELGQFLLQRAAEMKKEECSNQDGPLV